MLELNRAQAMAIWSYFNERGFDIVENLRLVEQRGNGELWFEAEGHTPEVVRIEPTGHRSVMPLSNGRGASRPGTGHLESSSPLDATPPKS